MRESKAFYYIALLVLYTSWLPVKSIAYLVPLLSVVIYIWWIPKKKSIYLFGGYMAFFFIECVFHALIQKQFVWPSALLAIITYSTFAFLLVIRSSPYHIRETYDALLPHVQLMTLIQSSWGVVQAVYGAWIMGSFDLDTGDFVEGTVHPGLMAERAFSNPIFAVNMLFLVIFLIPSLKRGDKRSLWLIIAGSFALLLASVVHILAFIFIAACITFVFLDFEKLTRGKYIKYIPIILSIPVLLFFTQPKNFSLIGQYALKIASGKLPKVTITLRSFTTVPEEYPYMPLIGLGPGQFVSRASFIGSGRYLGDQFNNPSAPIPFTKPQTSPAFKEYVLDLWKLSREDVYGGGATAKPYYSLLAVYTEFGLVAIIAGWFWFYGMLKKLKMLRRDKERQLVLYLFTIGGLVLLFLGFQENYWEIPQSLLWGIITLMLFYNMLIKEYKVLIIRIGDEPDYERATGSQLLQE